MAEWLGNFMSNWPVWAIAVGAIIIFIGGAALYWATEILPWTAGKKKRENLRGKK